ncbi:hypothetical protein JOC85_001597 [Bacillus mesophilus]|uniref:DUF1189 domain-containing protein n=1 Tax=Bacillus mesophilus TaxID=1808955 RepID=A0A6M0Q9A9_9BACI|nr:DUF1189 domain-containing protein [Bacillus mesophilus]MBM7660825.1 hypothetical protein [Bacillus mesophilus]NEY71628.1 DUF1189 domain-containing protein [Bacillus mesophilus]
MSLLQQWIKSLYSPKDIAKLRFQTIGKTILYVFLLTLLSIIPASIYNSMDIVKGVNDFNHITDTTLPDFSIENQKLVSEVNEPTLYNVNGTYVLFDPTGEWKADELEKYNNSIGFLSNELVYHSNNFTQSFPYDMLGDLDLTKETMSDYIDTFSEILPILLALIILATYIFAAGIKFIEISIFALFGLTLSNLLKKTIPYRRLWVLSAYCITLAVTFLALMNLLKIEVISSYFVYWFVTLMMLYLSLREIPSKK